MNLTRRLGIIALTVGVNLIFGALLLRLHDHSISESFQKIILYRLDSGPVFAALNLPRWCDLAILGLLGLVASTYLTGEAGRFAFSGLGGKDQAKGVMIAILSLTVAAFFAAITGTMYALNGLLGAAPITPVIFLASGLSLGFSLNFLNDERRKTIIKIMKGSEEQLRLAFVSIYVIIMGVVQITMLGTCLGLMFAGVGFIPSIVIAFLSGFAAWVAVHIGTLPGLLVTYLRGRNHF